ncbi:WW domain-containing protein wwm1 [Clavispora lusitaniae]|nr:WW domain-containing protein wwm1 [Clavispora lusitaniae]
MTNNDPNNQPIPPEGWTARFDDKYKTWFYVNLSTKKSQWEPPKGTTFKDAAADIGPPPYSPSQSKNDDTKSSHPAASQPNNGQSPRKSGLGGGAGLAMGAGAGLLGGMLVGDMIQDSQMDAYQDGYMDGADGDSGMTSKRKAGFSHG